MTEADELAAARAAHVAAVEAERRWQLASDRLQRLVDERQRAAERLQDLQHEAGIEQEEADEWAGRGFLQLVQWLFGRLDERRDIESSQALAAAARLATAQASVASLDAAISTARDERPRRGDVVHTLDQLRTVWARIDPAGHVQAVALDQAAAAATALVIEHDEAIAAVDRCDASAGVAEQHLSSARNWGTYDIIGGGFIASSFKKARVQEALSAIESTTAGVAAVRHELADIPHSIALPNGLEMASGAWTWDVWFDNIFSDFNMQDRIREAATKVALLRSELAATRQRLTQARASAMSAASAAAARAAAEWNHRA